MAFDFRKSSSTTSSAKDILKKYRCLVAQKSAEKDIENKTSRPRREKLEVKNQVLNGPIQILDESGIMNTSNSQCKENEKKVKVESANTKNEDDVKQTGNNIKQKQVSNASILSKSRALRTRSLNSLNVTTPSLKPVDKLLKNVSSNTNYSRSNTLMKSYTKTANGVKDTPRKNTEETQSITDINQSSVAISPATITSSEHSENENEVSVWEMFGTNAKFTPWKGSRDKSDLFQSNINLLSVNTNLSGKDEDQNVVLSICDASDEETIESSKEHLSCKGKEKLISPVSSSSLHTFSIGGRTYTLNMKTPLKQVITTVGTPQTGAISVITPDKKTDVLSTSGRTVIPNVIANDDSPFNFDTPSSHHSKDLSVSNRTTRTTQSQQGSFATKIASTEQKRERIEMNLNEIAFSKKIIELQDALKFAEAERDAEKKKRKECESRLQNMMVKHSKGRVSLSSQNTTQFKDATALSLIERNKTLVKEVRFADQTCVELSERNSSMEIEINRLKEEGKELKDEKKSLEISLREAEKHNAKVEENSLKLELELAEKQSLHQVVVNNLKEKLSQSSAQELSLKKDLEESRESCSVLDRKLASALARYEALATDLEEAKEKIVCLTERITANYTTSELTAEAAAESYRMFSVDMEKRLCEMHDLCDEQKEELNDGKIKENEYILKINNLERKCKHLEESVNNYENVEEKIKVLGMETPQKSSASHHRTPTSTVLAKTLQTELRKSHEVNRRILKAEQIVASNQIKLNSVTKELKESKEKINDLQSILNEFYSQEDEEYLRTISKLPKGRMPQNNQNILSELQFIDKDFQAKISAALKLRGDESICTNTVISKLLQLIEKFVYVCNDINSKAAENQLSYSLEIKNLITFVKGLQQHHDFDSESCGFSCSDTLITHFRENIHENASNPELSLISISKHDTSIERSSDNTAQVLSHNSGMATVDQSMKNDENTYDNQLAYSNGLIHEFSNLRREIEALRDEYFVKERANHDKVAQLENELTQIKLNQSSELHEGEGVMNQVKQQQDSTRTELANMNYQSESLYYSMNDESVNFEVEEVGKTSISGQESSPHSIKNHFKYDELLDQNNELQDQLKNNIALAEKEKSDLMERNEMLQKKIEELNMSMEDLKLQIIAFEQKTDETSLDGKQQSLLIEELREELAEIKEELFMLKTSYTSSNDELAELRDTNFDTEKICNELQSKCSSYEIEIKEKKEQIANMQNELQDREKDYENIIFSKESKLRDMRVEHESELSKKKELELEFQKEIKKLDLTNEKLKQIIEDKIECLNEKETEINFLETKVSLLSTESNELKSAHEKEFETMEAKMRTNSAELSRCKNVILEKAEQNNDLHRNCSELKTELNHLNTLLKKKEELIGEKRQQITELGSKNESLDQKCEKLRECTIKLTQKCNSWEESYKKQQLGLRQIENCQQDSLKKLSEMMK